MNPFGPPVPFPAVVNNVYSDNGAPHATSKIHGDWLVVYSWPPDSKPTPQPGRVTFGQPSILQSALFKCRCRQQVAATCPITVKDDEKIEVKACELVDKEANVPAALNRTSCSCQTTPFYEKIVVLPVGEHLLVYQRRKNVKYTPEEPNTCLLLVKQLPEDLEIKNIVGDMDVVRRKGGCTFQI